MLPFTRQLRAFLPSLISSPRDIEEFIIDRSINNAAAIYGATCYHLSSYGDNRYGENPNGPMSESPDGGMVVRATRVFLISNGPGRNQTREKHAGWTRGEEALPLRRITWISLVLDIRRKCRSGARYGKFRSADKFQHRRDSDERVDARWRKYFVRGLTRIRLVRMSVNTQSLSGVRA